MTQSRLDPVFIVSFITQLWPLRDESLLAGYLHCYIMFYVFALCHFCILGIPSQLTLMTGNSLTPHFRQWEMIPMWAALLFLFFQILSQKWKGAVCFKWASVFSCKVEQKQHFNSEQKESSSSVIYHLRVPIQDVWFHISRVIYSICMMDPQKAKYL